MLATPSRKYTRRLGLTAALLAVLVGSSVAGRQATASNLLQNGSMEAYHQYATDPGSGWPLRVANGWNMFIEAGSPYYLDVDSYAWSPWGSGWKEGFEGENNQMIFTPVGSGSYTAGLYQQVTGLTPGTAYSFSGRVLSIGNTPVGRKLGIDPFGGTDPTSPNIVWGVELWSTQADRWQGIWMSEIVRSTTATVFVRIEHPVVPDAGHGEIFLDSYVLDPSPIAHTNALPAISSSPSFGVSWGLDWRPPETLFRLEPGGEWYEVQARGAGNPWAYWIPRTTGTSATYQGQDCKTYDLRTRAIVMHEMISNVGSRLPSYWPPEGQVRTTVLTAPPTSVVSALPAYHRSAAQVSWSGSPGSCGITGYDVQVRDGIGGVWSGWLTATIATTAPFTGQAGRTYYFRSAARGIGGYVEPFAAGHDASTTFDRTPPSVSISPLPAVVSTTALAIAWSGADTASGLASFDVVTRSIRLADDQDSGWQPWLTGVTATGAQFTPQAAHRYLFQVRSRDNAGNVSAAAETATNVLTTLSPLLVSSAKMASPWHTRPGDELTYVLTLSNTGSLSAAVEMEDHLPEGCGVLVTQTMTATAGTLTWDGEELGWEGTIGAGTQAVLTYTVRLSETLPLGIWITNTAVFSDGVHAPFSRTVTTLVGHLQLLPLVTRD